MGTNEESGEINGRIKEQKAQIFRVTNLLILISIIGIIIFGLFSVDKNIYAYILSLTGLMLSAFLLLKEKYFFENEIIDICKIGKRLDCDKVIHSDKSKIYGFSLAEISSGFFLFLVIGSVLNISFFSIVKPIIYLSSASIIYSIYQQIKLKTYCIVCIFISLNLVLLIYVSYTFDSDLNSLNYVELLLPLIFTILIVALAKNYLSTNEDKRRLESQKNSILNSFLVSSAYNNNKVKNKRFDHEITIGKENSNYEIILFINPLCSKCKKVLKILPRLFSEFEDNVFVRILYSGTIHEKSEQQIAFARLENYLKELTDNEKLEILKKENFLRYIDNRISVKHLDSFNHQNLWSNELSLDGTPAFILNNIVLPSFFSAEDLILLLRNLKNKV